MLFIYILLIFPQALPDGLAHAAALHFVHEVRRSDKFGFQPDCVPVLCKSRL